MQVHAVAEAERWRRLAGWSGGTVSGFATLPGGDVLAATATGLFRSTDGGRTWAYLQAGNCPPLAAAIVPSPGYARDRTLFLGTAAGLFCSDDGGEHWQHVLGGDAVQAVSVSPAYGEDGTLFAATAADGILRSRDGGRTWRRVNPGLLDLSVLTLALSPSFARDRTGYAGTASGLYRTRTGGDAWRLMDLPWDNAVIQCLLVSEDETGEGLVLAGTEQAGLLRSSDGGRTWEQVPALADHSVLALASHPGFPRVPLLVAATDRGIAVSPDGGIRWHWTEAGPDPALAVTIIPRGGHDILLAGLAKHGVVRSLDLGATWTSGNAGLSARPLLSLALSPTFSHDRTLFVAGASSGVLASVDGGVTWRVECVDRPTTATHDLAPAALPGGDWQVYAATTDGLYRRHSSASAWLPVGGVGSGPTTLVSTAATRSREGTPAVLAARPGGEVLVAADGERWRSLGRPDGVAEVLSLAAAHGAAGRLTLWVGACDAGGDLGLWCSPDGGARWERWLRSHGVQALPLAASPDYAHDATLFAGLGGRIVRLVASERGTATGRRHDAVLGDGRVAVTAVRPSPDFARDTTVFAGTSDGVYVSRDGGRSFARWSVGLEPAAVVAIAVSPAYGRDRLVYALGLGGTLWQRRDPV